MNQDCIHTRNCSIPRHQDCIHIPNSYAQAACKHSNTHAMFLLYYLSQHLTSMCNNGIALHYNFNAKTALVFRFLLQAETINEICKQVQHHSMFSMHILLWHYWLQHVRCTDCAGPAPANRRSIVHLNMPSNVKENRSHAFPSFTC